MHDALTDAKLNLARWKALEAFRAERAAYGPVESHH
jgi:hypothetical protein